MTLIEIIFTTPIYKRKIFYSIPLEEEVIESKGPKLDVMCSNSKCVIKLRVSFSLEDVKSCDLMWIRYFESHCIEVIYILL